MTSSVDVARVHGVNPHETKFLHEEIFGTRAYLRGGLSIPPGAVVVDVGANIGMFTLFAHAEAPDVRVLAFEPLAPLVAKLRQNVADFGVTAEVFGCGLSDVEREVEFTYYPGYTTMSTLRGYADTEADKAFIGRQVRAEPGADPDMLEYLDEILDYRFTPVTHPGRLRRLSTVLDERGLDRVDLLKIDVQRAELDVLRGIDEHHWLRIRQVSMEVHDAPGTETEGRLAEAMAILTEHGFEVTQHDAASAGATDRYALAARLR
jgi:L-glutamate---[L-glutamyl-carrier protein] ligase